MRDSTERHPTVQLSIRNLDGVVEAVTVGPAMTTVRTRLPGGQDVTAAITSEAAAELDLRAGASVRVLVKSTEISVALGEVGRVSIRNLLPGIVTAVDNGEVMSTVKLDIGNGDVLTATITREAAGELGLAIGVAVTAMVKSTDVAIARP